MHVTFNMFLMHGFGFSESYNVFSFKKSTFLKQKSLRLQKKSLISRKGMMTGSVLHYILGYPLLHHEAILDESFHLSKAYWFPYHIHLYFLFLSIG